MKKKIVLIFAVLLSILSFAQSDKDVDQQLIYAYIYSKDFDKAKAIIDNKFLNSDDESKQVIGYVYLADYYATSEDENKKTEALEEAKKTAIRTQKPLDMAYVNFGYARYYQKLEKNELFIKSINKSIEVFSKYPNENFVLTHLYFLRYSYKSKNSLEDNDRLDCIKANEYALKSKNNILINYTYNNLGYHYKKKYNESQVKKYLDSADSSYRSSERFANLISNPEAKKRSLIVFYLNYGSLAAILFPENNAEESFKLYNKALKLSENDKKFGYATSMVYNNIGSIYENSNNLEKALEFYLKAYHLSINNKDVFTVNKITILNNLSRVYEEKQQLDVALKYEREAKELITNDAKEQYENNTKSLEIFYQTQEKDKEIKQLAEENKIFTKQKALYLGIILLSIAGIIFLSYTLYYRQKLNTQKTNLLEIEKHEAELTLQLEQEEKARLKAEQELLEIKQEHLQKQALATSLQLNHKNSFINDLKEKIKEDKALNLDIMWREENLMDKDFVEIQNLVQEVHPYFFKRLNDASKSKLTNQDLKYAAYIYLNMDNQQISNILKVEPKTVRMTKYRLKQKLGLDKDVDLQMFIQNLQN